MTLCTTVIKENNALSYSQSGHSIPGRERTVWGLKTCVMHEEPRRLGDKPLKNPAVKGWGWMFESSWGYRMANHVAEACSLRVDTINEHFPEQ